MKTTDRDEIKEMIGRCLNSSANSLIAIDKRDCELALDGAGDIVAIFVHSDNWDELLERVHSELEAVDTTNTTVLSWLEVGNLIMSQYVQFSELLSNVDAAKILSSLINATSEGHNSLLVICK